MAQIVRKTNEEIFGVLIQICLCVLSFLFGFLAPVFAKLFVNNSIEKRYKCKLNLDDDRSIRILFYHYIKLVYPAAAIAGSYLFKNRAIQKHLGLSEISYTLETATKQEIVVSCLISIFFVIISAAMVFTYIAIKISKFSDKWLS